MLFIMPSFPLPPLQGLRGLTQLSVSELAGRPSVPEIVLPDLVKVRINTASVPALAALRAPQLRTAL